MPDIEPTFNLTFHLWFSFRNGDTDKKYEETRLIHQACLNKVIAITNTFISITKLIINLSQKNSLFEEDNHQVCMIATHVSTAVLMLILTCLLQIFHPTIRFIKLIGLAILTVLFASFICYIEKHIYFEAFHDSVNEIYFQIFLLSIFSSVILRTNLLKFLLLVGLSIFYSLRLNHNEMNVPNNIADLVLIIIVIEILAFTSELNSMNIFKNSCLLERTSEFYYELVDLLSSPLIIFKGGEKWHVNKEMEQNKIFFPQILISTSVTREKLAETLETNYKKQSYRPNFQTTNTLPTSSSYIDLGVYKVTSKDIFKYYKFVLLEKSFVHDNCSVYLVLQVIDFTEAFINTIEEQASNWKNKLMGKISHEFTSPLISIQTIIEESEFFEKDFCQKTHKLCSYLLSLTKQIEDYFLVNSVKKPNLERFNLIDICELIEQEADIFDNLENTLKNSTDRNLFEIVVFDDHVRTNNLNQVTLFTKSCGKTYYMLFFNLFAIFQGINRSKIDLKIQKVSETHAKMTLECKTDFDLEKMLSESTDAVNYSEYQSLDIAHYLCNYSASFLCNQLIFTTTNEIIKAEFVFEYSEFKISSFNSNDTTVICDDPIVINANNSFEDDIISILKNGKERKESKMKTMKIVSFEEDSVVRQKEKKRSSQTYDNRLSFKLKAEIMRRNKTKSIILVVDDLEPVRKALVNMCLKILGDKYRIEEIEDGIDIIDRMFYYQNNPAKGNIIVILSDEFMLEMNGSEALGLLKRFHSAGYLKEVPFITCTAFSDETNLEVIRKNEPLAILNKPIQKEELASLLIRELKL